MENRDNMLDFSCLVFSGMNENIYCLCLITTAMFRFSELILFVEKIPKLYFIRYSAFAKNI